jgi:alginate O-acetyltransferase complex protein AlgI
MLFTNFDFLFYIPIILSLYFITPQKIKWVVLLLGSYFFYLSFKLEFLPSLIFNTLVVYLFGITIKNSKSAKTKKLVLIFGIAYLVMFLFFFKYYNFFSENLNQFFHFSGFSFQAPVLNITMPLGASYYVFLMIGYLVDVYFNRISAESNIGKFGLFVAFFPKLVSGPIERGKSFLPQINKKSEIQYDLISSGFKLFLWGFFKKVVIADRIAEAVNNAYSFPDNFSGITLLFVAVLYAFQLYADFSGYTDMALGIAKMFGFNLTNNFNRPYISESISEFWKRWHITLSNWLRDYIFLPLAYSVTRRIMKSKSLKIKPEVYAYIFGIIITMSICGIWHGAKWTFIAWGFMHGIFLAIGFLTKKKKSRILKKFKINKKYLKISRIIITFALVSLSFILFRAESFASAILVYKKIFLLESGQNITDLFALNIDFVISVICVILLMAYDFFPESRERSSNAHPVFLKYYFIVVIFLIIFFFGKFNQSDFLYFKF